MTTQKEESGIQAERDEILGSGADGLRESLEVAIRYPTESDDAIRTIAIGGLLSLLAFLVVPVFILAGYFIRVLNRTAGGDEVPPVFDEWGELAVTGLQAVLIGVAYALVPTILGGGVVAIGIGLSGDGSLDGLGVAAVLVGGLLWTLLSFVVAYLLPAALVNFARTRSLGAGFAFGTLKPIWLSRSYAVAWGTMLLVALLGGIVAGYSTSFRSSARLPESLSASTPRLRPTPLSVGRGRIFQSSTTPVPTRCCRPVSILTGNRLLKLSHE